MLEVFFNKVADLPEMCPRRFYRKPPVATPQAFSDCVILENIDLFLSSFFIIINCYLAALRLTLRHSQGDNLTNPTLITAF